MFQRLGNRIAHYGGLRAGYELANRVPEPFRGMASVVGESLLGMILPDGTRKWRLQRDFNWELLLPDMGGIDGTEVSQYCQAVTFSDYGMQQVSKIRYGPYRRSYAGFYEIDDLSLTFVKPVPDYVSNYLYTWKSMITDERGFYYPKLNYAKNTYISLFDRDGSSAGSFTFKGVFPKTAIRHKLAYANEGIVKLSIDFNVDTLDVVL